MAKRLETAKAKLTIMSRTLSPEEISRKLGLHWDDAQRVGNRKGRSNQIWDTNVWYLYETSEGNENELPVEKALDECLRRLRERISDDVAASINDLSRSEIVELGMYMLSQTVPPVHLAPDTLAFIHQLGAELDIDIVLYGDD